MYTVKAVAKLAQVSVRALHHYDAIGLLKPSKLSEAGYRLYEEADLERLQQILFFRELEFSLQDIKLILDQPGFERKSALLAHRQLLEAKQRHLQALIRSIDQSVESLDGGEPMSPEQLFHPFDDAEIQALRAEARERWGTTQAYTESERRASRYSAQDWQEIQAEAGAIFTDLAALMDRSPSDPDVQAVIARWWRHLDARFYPVTPEIFRGLGEGYVADPRFTATYDRFRPGLAQFKRDAMVVYCDRLEQRP